MKIGIIGWYGHQNFGDERILYCLKRFFCNDELIICTSLDDALDKIEILNSCNFVFFGGGGLILRGFNIYVKLIEKIKVRFACIGISVEYMKSDNAKFVKILKEKSEFIYVRDKMSKKMLDNYYKVIVGPDLTFLYPYESLNVENKHVCGVNLRDWHYWKSSHNGNLFKMMNWINRKFDGIERVYPFKKWNPEKCIETIKRRYEFTEGIPFYFEDKTKNDFLVLKKFFNELENCDRGVEDYYSQLKLIIGMRLHALIFATQMGIPFIALAYQPKDYNYCSDIGMEQLAIDLFEIETLENKIDYLEKNYSWIREGLLEYRNEANIHVNNIMDNIDKLIRL